MTFCKVCKFPIGEKRAKAGYDTCILHGDRQANLEIQEKQNRVAPLFNKGGYQYAGSSATAKELAKDFGKKTSAVEIGGPVVSDGNGTNTNQREPTLEGDAKSKVRDKSQGRGIMPLVETRQANSEPPPRMQIGTYWLTNGDAHVLWEGEDPVVKGACRWVMLDQPRPFRIGHKRRTNE